MQTRSSEDSAKHPTAPRRQHDVLSHTLPVAASITGLSTSTLRRHEKAGRLRFFHVGGRTLVDAASLRALLAGGA